MSARSLVSLALVLGLTALVGAQQQPTFRSDVELVTLPLTVSRRDRDRSIGELTAADFRVFQDGVEQDLTLLDRSRRPVSLCIVLDASNSMTPHRTRLAHTAIDATLAGLGGEDEAAVIGFSGLVNVALPRTPAGRIDPIRWHEWRQGDSTSRVRPEEAARRQVPEAEGGGEEQGPSRPAPRRLSGHAA